MLGLLISICLLTSCGCFYCLEVLLQEHEKVSGHARQKSGYQEIEVEVMGAIRLKPLS